MDSLVYDRSTGKGPIFKSWKCYRHLLESDSWSINQFLPIRWSSTSCTCIKLSSWCVLWYFLFSSSASLRVWCAHCCWSKAVIHVISFDYQGQPNMLMNLLKQTAKSQSHRQPQRSAVPQKTKPCQSHKICPQRTLTGSTTVPPWKWSKTSTSKTGRSVLFCYVFSE